MSKKHPHTVFVHFNKDEVKNEFEEPVTEDQIHGRSLVKAFTVAATYARQTYGVSNLDFITSALFVSLHLF